MDIKRLRSDLDLIDMTVSRTDMRVHLIELSEKGKKNEDNHARSLRFDLVVFQH